METLLHGARGESTRTIGFTWPSDCWEQRDRPMLQSLQQLHRRPIKLPRRAKDHPDRERLAIRFEQFRTAA